MDKILIGMIHLDKIRWIDENRINEVVIKAKKDLKTLENVGFKYVCIVNENDIPYNITISNQEKNVFLYIAKKLKKIAKIHIWICVLYNDRKATLEIAKEIDATFIRIDTFVDLVESDAWIISPEAKNIMTYKKKLWLNKLIILTDIHPKYKKMLEKKTLLKSAYEAQEKWSNGIIITGNKSWEIITFKKLKDLREWIDIKIYLWSWVSEENIEKYWKYIDGAFIGTSLKKDNSIDINKAKSFITYCNKL